MATSDKTKKLQLLGGGFASKKQLDDEYVRTYTLKEGETIENAPEWADEVIDPFSESEVIQGPKGDKGDTGPEGPRGPQGIQGPQGEQGPKGDTGSNGKDGVSTTHSWNGTVLTVTSASGSSSADLKGPKGDKGDTGATGPKGEDGSDANVTAQTIKNVLGYAPANTDDVETLSKEKADKAGWSPDKYIGTDAKGNLIEKDAPAGGAGGTATYYVATDYGISTDAEDNTPALQTLVNSVHDSGGGIIYFPVGTYKFQKTADTKYAILMQSNVSIVGENIENTIFKQTGAVHSMFYRMGDKSDPIHGCTFNNFTVDAYDTTGWQVYGKALFFQYVKDCVFRDIRLLGTPATALGIDFLDRVTIDGVLCVDCGRMWIANRVGSSGIGIGTGGWDNENFVVSNCICVGSGQFGIFVEDQGWLTSGGAKYAKGMVISNCIVRNGLNNGIGVRGGANITIIGCETYENTNDGIYIDANSKNIRIMSCSATANGRDGIHIYPDDASQRLTIKGCVAVDNVRNGITVYAASDKLCIAENYTDGNVIGLDTQSLTLIDCVLHGNTFMDGVNILADFDGNTEHIDIGAPTSIHAEDMIIETSETQDISYTVVPEYANKSVTYSSSDVSVATVSDAGVVRGITAGNCEITIRSKVDTSVYKVINILVEVGGGALHPLLNGEKTMSDGVLTVSGGNHVKIVQNTTSLSYYNISDYTQNGDTFASSDNINGSGKNTLFTLKAGDVVRVTAKNIVASAGTMSGIAVAGRTTSNETVTKLGNFAGTESEMTSEFTISNETNVALILLTVQGYTSVEMDVSYTVNGVKYI